MYQVNTIPQDDISAAAINRRKRLDEERKLRVFNPKIRMLGVLG
jgi:hypothetical protein